MDLSHVNHPDDLNNTLLPHGCILEMVLAMKQVVGGRGVGGECISPTHRKAHEKLLIVWIQPVTLHDLFQHLTPYNQF